MALVSGGRSTLNPNAPLFIPAAVRQVEDFSPEWWQLVTTSTWFHDYWLNQQQGDDDFYGNNEDDLEDIAGLLPDTIDLGNEEEFLNMEAQFEQFIQSSEAEAGTKPFLFDQKGMLENGMLLINFIMRCHKLKFVATKICLYKVNFFVCVMMHLCFLILEVPCLIVKTKILTLIVFAS